MIDGKTEFLHFHPHHKQSLDISITINIGNDSIDTAQSAKTLDVHHDSDLTLSPYTTSICKLANFHLFRLTCIRIYLGLEALKTAIHFLVSSEMD